jgi:hypothetical protein
MQMISCLERKISKSHDDLQVSPAVLRSPFLFIFLHTVLVFADVSILLVLIQRPQDLRELPRPLHYGEGLRLQGLWLPPHHPPVYVPGW